MRLVTLTFAICAAIAIAAPSFAEAEEDSSKTTTEKVDEKKGESTPPAKADGKDEKKAGDTEKTSE